jgi:hypothetical protein
MGRTHPGDRLNPSPLIRLAQNVPQVLLLLLVMSAADAAGVLAIIQ